MKLEKLVKFFIPLVLLILVSLELTSCSTFHVKDGAPLGEIDVNKIPNAVPKAEPRSKYGNPRYYYVHGRRQYVLKTAKGYNKVGYASWYGTKFNGQLTSNREYYNLYGMTAASRDLPIPTYVRVTNLANGKSVIVKVNDRGPFVGNRLIDLTYVAAKKLGYANRGTALVRVTAIDPRNPIDNIPSPLNRHSCYLQVGAFSNRSNAEKYKNRVANLTSAPVYIHTTHHKNIYVYKVQIGPLAQTESTALRLRLQKNGLDTVHVIS